MNTFITEATERFEKQPENTEGDACIYLCVVFVFLYTSVISVILAV